MDNDTFWMICYANVLAMQFHPGTRSEARLSYREIGSICDKAVLERSRMLSESTGKYLDSMREAFAVGEGK